MEFSFEYKALSKNTVFSFIGIQGFRSEVRRSFYLIELGKYLQFKFVLVFSGENFMFFYFWRMC
ncbi:hypothetical protein LEP1GSC137_3150 [Leptospira borgpetersenii str. Noumea 25]|nr:hypothetical protein LEP1GSC137_3150 [Leptospira borgpetersenii str. Noumea 25]